MTRLIATGAVIAAALAAPSAASAQGAYVGVGVGPAVRIDDWPTQIRVEQEIGFFVNRSPRGFYIAFAPSQSWGDDFWILVFPVRLGGVFDLFRGRDVAFQIGGTGTLGFGLSNPFNVRRDPDPWFHLSFGLILRVLFANERVGVYLRPVDFEFAIGDSPWYGREAIRYVLAGGLQFFF